MEIRRSGFLDFSKSGRSGSGRDQEIIPPVSPIPNLHAQLFVLNLRVEIENRMSCEKPAISFQILLVLTYKRAFLSESDLEKMSPLFPD